MDFIALDVETANSDMASICQIGIVAFKDGEIAESWQSLVNPEDYFDDMNISIHGIDDRMVKESPVFSDIFEDVQSRLHSKIVVSHMAFDRIAITRVLEKYTLEHIPCTWLDSAKVIRRAWPEFAQRGYGLANAAEHFGIEFKHHDAENDARAAGELLLKAICDTGITLNEWLKRVQQPIASSKSRKA